MAKTSLNESIPQWIKLALLQALGILPLTPYKSNTIEGLGGVSNTNNSEIISFYNY
jgi:hypothetical protein